MVKFSVKIKRENLKKGFRDGNNYTVLAIDKDQILLGDKLSKELEWFSLENVEFFDEIE